MPDSIENIHPDKACTKRECKITADDLPLSCPPKGERIWDAHPRVYLPIEALNEVVCPYCECKYILEV